MQKIKKFFTNKENYAIVLGSLIALIGLSVPFTIYFLNGKKPSLGTFQSLGAVGDFLGGSTVGFLSLASMLFVVAAIVMQKEELKLQRNELQLTREELEKTREEHALSNKTQKLQQFENTLFNMIMIHGQLINDLKAGKGDDGVTGRNVITGHYMKINQNYKLNEYSMVLKRYLTELSRDVNSRTVILNFLNKLSELKNEDSDILLYLKNIIASIESFPIAKYVDYSKQIRISIKYDEILKVKSLFPDDEFSGEFIRRFGKPGVNKYKINALVDAKRDDRQLLSHYIKSVSAILNLIESNRIIQEEEKNQYIKLFFSQFTIYEISVLEYYTYLDGNETLKNLMEKYKVFEWNEISSDSIFSVRF